MDRRLFMEKALTLGLGCLAAIRGGVSWAKDLPSDPEGSSGRLSGADIVSLPAFEKGSPFPLEKALLERRSVRSYDPARKLSPEEISRLLWAADGANRPDGRRTAPSAKAKYPVDVLAALPEGVFLYEPKGHQMRKVIPDDIRAIIPIQDNFKSASMIVLYMIDTDKVPDGRMNWADLEIGCIGQNLFLEAAALGLASCIFAYVQIDKVSKALGLKGNQVLRIAQAVGAAK